MANTRRQLEAKHQIAKLSGAKTDNGKRLARQEIRPDRIGKMRDIFVQDIFPDDKEIKEYADLVAKSKKLTEKQTERMNEISLELVMQYGLKNGLWVKNLDHDKYYEALGKIRHDVVAECSCKTSLELMLTDRIVASYWRAMKCDMIFNRLVEKEDGKFSFDQLKVNILKEFNKGIELANRQLNTNMILLKELKQPALNFSVKTKTAFVAQNQQLNINQPNKNDSNEIIKSK